MLDALKVGLFYTGKIEEAVHFGQRALDLRDAEPPAADDDHADRAKGPAVGATSFRFRCGARRRSTATAP